MHNNIMAAGLKDRPPMLGPGRYSQWRSHFLWYIDTKPNGEGLRKSILSGPYVPSTVLVQAVAATEGNPAIQQHTTIETVLNMTPENKENFLSEKEAIFLLLTGIGDDIYSTVDACKTANEMWIAIERLQQVNDIRAERISKSANPLALLAAALKIITIKHQNLKDLMQHHLLQDLVHLPDTKSKCNISHFQRDKDMQKNLALLAKYFKKLYKPTNNNLRTSSNSRNKTEDTTPRYNNDNQSGQFGNQRTMTVVGARETVGSQVVQQNGIQCFNCKGFGHYAKDAQPKRVKRSTRFTMEKMMMWLNKLNTVFHCKLSNDWLADTDEEIDEQELEAHYSFMAKIQEVLPEESSSTDQPLEQPSIRVENLEIDGIAIMAMYMGTWGRQIQRISWTGFPAQSVGSSNIDVLDLPCLLVLITGTSQSRQHGFPFVIVNTKEYHSECSGRITRIMRRTLVNSL
ncbi:hypothetical protein Tco_0727578 [Tanacetum coccineum]|uniref:CCHC-type domain-containing protein n=1 Tax=Tanacetum coccineum TaxID=301880 RepID=A0ABQ4YLA4_9ASTR